MGQHHVLDQVFADDKGAVFLLHQPDCVCPDGVDTAERLFVDLRSVMKTPELICDLLGMVTIETGINSFAHGLNMGHKGGDIPGVSGLLEMQVVLHHIDLVKHLLPEHRHLMELDQGLQVVGSC